MGKIKFSGQLKEESDVEAEYQRYFKKPVCIADVVTGKKRRKR